MERYEAELRKLRPLCLDDRQRLPHERVAYFRKKRWQLRAWATSGCTSKWRTSGNRRLGHNDFGPPSHAAYLWPTTSRQLCAGDGFGLQYHGQTTTAAAARARGRFRADMTCRNASGSRIRSVSKRQVSSKTRRQLRAWATASGSSSRRVNVLVSEEHEKRKHEVERKKSKPDELRKLSARRG